MNSYNPYDPHAPAPKTPRNYGRLGSSDRDSVANSSAQSLTHKLHAVWNKIQAKTQGHNSTRAKKNNSNTSARGLSFRKINRKIVAIIAVVLVLLLVLIGGVVEVYERSHIGKCISLNIGKILHSPTTVSLGSAPLIVDYLTNNQPHLVASAQNIYERKGLNVHIDVYDTKIDTGISQRVQVKAQWGVPELSDNLKVLLHKNELFSQIPFFNMADIKVHSKENEHALELDIMLPIVSGPVASLTIKPIIKDNSLYFKVINSTVNFLGITAPTAMGQQIVDSVQQIGGDDLTPKIPSGLEYSSITVNNQNIDAELIGKNYPPAQTNDGSQPVNIAKMCKP